MDLIKSRVKMLLDGLSDNFKPAEMENVIFQYFANTTHEFCYLPKNFLFKFELNRLKFTYFAAIKYTKVIII